MKKTHGISVDPEVFKKTDLVKVLPDVAVTELKKSTNIDSQKDSYSEIRYVVTTIVHNHMTAATPIDLDTHTHHEQREEHRESEDYEDQTEEDHDSEQHDYLDEEGGPTCHR